jgi:tryptophan-rich sensory protein
VKKSKRGGSLLAFAGFGAAALAAGWVGSKYSPRDARTQLWYRRLKKPSFNPPQYVFPVVWTALYALMAVSGWRVWRKEDSRERSRALSLWASQLVSNAAWTKFFFGDHRPVLALADVVVLESMLVRYIAITKEIDRPAAACFVPYAGWVAFATVLNADIARLNPDARKKFPWPRAA